MTNFNIDDYTDDDLKSIAKQIEAELTVRKDKARKEIAEKIRDLAASIDMTPEEVLAAAPKQKRKRAPAAPKYRDPATGQTWSGRGRKPSWVQTALSAGTTLEELKI